MYDHAERPGGGLVAGEGAVDHVRRGEDLAGLRARGQPRGEIDGVAGDGVRASCQRADVAGEREAAVCTGAEREADVPADDRAQCAQHRLLVVPGRRRRAAGEVDLAAVGVDVGLEPREADLRGRVPDDGAQRGQPLEQRVFALRRQHAVAAGPLHEPGGDLAVLGLDPVHERRAQRLRDEVVESLRRRVDGRPRRRFHVALRLESSQQPSLRALGV